MKSPRSITPKSPPQQDHLDPELTLTIGSQISESSKIIYNIKQSLYELLKINVTATIPVRRYETPPAIVAGSKRNLDDLKRIQSMVKGYLTTVRLEADNSVSEDDVADNKVSDTHSHHNSSINTSNNQPIQSPTPQSPQTTPFTIPPPTKIPTFTTNPTYNPITTTTTTTAISNNNTLNQTTAITNLNNSSTNNNQINMSNISEIRDRSLGEGQGQGGKGREILGDVGDVEEVGDKLPKTMPSANPTPNPKQSLNPIPQSPSQSPNLDLNLNLDINLPQEPTSQNIFSNKDKKLKNCRSAIFSASRNLQDIRTRNRQCLELIRSIKKEIGIRDQGRD